jgi:hypothetical protein
MFREPRPILRIVLSLPPPFALGAGCILIASLAAAQEARPRPRWPPFTVSEETTRLLGPLTGDGRVDFVTALNEIRRQGVTPENNAAVPFWRAVGPARIDVEQRGEFFRVLGIEPLPDEGEYLQSIEEFVLAGGLGEEPHTDMLEGLAEALEAEFEMARTRPWTAEEFPRLAQWLDAQARPLELVLAASRRERYFAPMIVVGRRNLWNVSLGRIAGLKLASRALLARAGLRLGRGLIAEAAEDIAAYRRLARLCGAAPTLVETFVATDVEDTALEFEVALARSGRPSAVELREYTKTLRDLPPLPHWAETIDGFGRFAFIDYMLSLAVGDAGSPSPRDGVEGPTRRTASLLETLKRGFVSAAYDWDRVLRHGNAWFDRAVEAFRRSSPLERREAIDNIVGDLSRQAANDELPLRAALTLLSPEWRSEAFARRWLERSGVAVAGEFCRRLEQLELRRSLVDVVFALEAHHAAHGAYPERLDALRPEYLDAVPQDLFTGGELRYRRRGGGYVLYSLGWDGKDTVEGTLPLEPEAGEKDRIFFLAEEDCGDDVVIVAAPRRR